MAQIQPNNRAGLSGKNEKKLDPLAGAVAADALKKRGLLRLS
jgi:hypothetical protein